MSPRKKTRRTLKPPRPWVAERCRAGMHRECSIAACTCLCHRRRNDDDKGASEDTLAL